MNLLIRLCITTALIMLLGHFLTGITITDVKSAVIVAIVLGLLNVFVKPVLVLLTIPATILTLGLFLLVINAVIIMMADYFVDGFSVNSFLTALIFSIILSVLQSVLNKIFLEEK